jgi:ATP-dependent Clp protease adapter protein ClpS
MGANVMAAIESPQKQGQSEIHASRDYLVIVYNNETNTFDEVTFIIMLATGCPPDEAEMETWEIHHLGKSVVHNASEPECTRIAEIIATIGIRVEVVKED